MSGNAPGLFPLRTNLPTFLACRPTTKRSNGGGSFCRENVAGPPHVFHHRKLSFTGCKTPLFGSRAYPADMTVELAVKFAHENLRIELEPEVIDALLLRHPRGALGNAYAMILSLLSVEEAALKRRWRRVDLAKWRAAGLSWPVLEVERPRAMPRKPVDALHRVAERHAKLLRLFNGADEAGKQHIEQAAAFAASSAKAAKLLPAQ